MIDGLVGRCRFMQGRLAPCGQERSGRGFFAGIGEMKWQPRVDATPFLVRTHVFARYRVYQSLIAVDWLSRCFARFPVFVGLCV
jgi:hypothetical protein